MENAAPPRKERVLLADAFPLVTRGLAALLGATAAVECREAHDGRAARRACAEWQPEFAFVDPELPHGGGFDLIRDLRAQSPRVRVLVLSAGEDAACLHRAFRAGAAAYLSKFDPLEDLRSILDLARQGKTYASPRLLRISRRPLDAVERPLHEEVATLSDREYHVFRLLGQKLGASAVAVELGVSVKTVETHQGRIKQKLRIPSCQALRQRALEWLACSALQAAPLPEFEQV
ncbi:MAG TPA: response regulator transcription factor [Chthoniobacteraceae bacterium]|jgi:DNA-binding NarL/FixJ family response regulator|nr:response regulator transcription factor [Chthoniobacteraceae bacterium]